MEKKKIEGKEYYIPTEEEKKESIKYRDQIIDILNEIEDQNLKNTVLVMVIKNYEETYKIDMLHLSKESIKR